MCAIMYEFERRSSVVCSLFGDFPAHMPFSTVLTELVLINCGGLNAAMVRNEALGLLLSVCIWYM